MAFCSEQKFVKARKDHRCTWCGETISKGENYWKWTGVIDAWTTSRVHPECLEPLDEECADNGGEYNPFHGERPEPVPNAPGKPTAANELNEG